MLRYTGHPLYDIGVATITAFAEKTAPEQVTEGNTRNSSRQTGRDTLRTKHET